MEKWWVSARRSSGKCRRTARVGSERSEPALSFTATSLSSIGVIRFVAAISNLISRELGWSMLCSAIPTEPAIEGINHQWRAGRCGKECAAWIQVQAAADNYEQKHKQAENQRVGVDPHFETTSSPIEFSEGGLVCRNGGLPKSSSWGRCAACKL